MIMVSEISFFIDIFIFEGNKLSVLHSVYAGNPCCIFQVCILNTLKILKYVWLDFDIFTEHFFTLEFFSQSVFPHENN